MNDVLFGYKGHSQHFTMIRFVNHLILVAKMCVGIFKYSTPLEIKFLFDRELTEKKKKKKKKKIRHLSVSLTYKNIA